MKEDILKIIDEWVAGFADYPDEGTQLDEEWDVLWEKLEPVLKQQDYKTYRRAYRAGWETGKHGGNKREEIRAKQQLWLEKKLRTRKGII